MTSSGAKRPLCLDVLLRDPGGRSVGASATSSWEGGAQGVVGVLHQVVGRSQKYVEKAKVDRDVRPVVRATQVQASI